MIDLEVLTRIPRLLEDVTQMLQKIKQQEDEILGTAEAARLLRIGTAELLDLARAGRVPHLRLGNGYKFSRLQLLETFRNQALENVLDDDAA
ncbi:helix-turn-helix domain-containing protein [Deinococcus radiopugnans]|uniref:Excisionase family DNA binding protein n=1 Tax=Deinococcus radiopugnans ATCC 19172 TaxID=585398 RepID=A0A5C4Y852_9DEIO|nr:helix-turn-helix domain-containing protein [Deinococcus radiopugnans]MBB6017469.1 excisionase family DNA binding protein [Deinococcus radiopugnans ATCC 19172]TNM71995.1 helix-turn-helix domain-containing protein [Deinococcus radiopugnans ATCC 19172]